MEKAKKIEIAILCTLFLSITIGAFCFVHYKIEKPNTYSILFKDVDSLVKGSPVRFMGMNVGHVTRLERKDDYIVCKIRVTKKNVKLPNGTRAKVAFNGLGGSKSVELFPPDKNENNPNGIIAEDFLRINDFVGVIKELRDVCITIYNMVDKFDANDVSSTMKTVTNPEGITKINNIMDRVTDSTIAKEKKVNKILANILKFFDKVKDKGDQNGKN